jgi:thiol-disulfide isomerase/thioredoxin
MIRLALVLALLLPTAALAQQPDPLWGHPVKDLDGKTIDPAQLLGKITLLDLWATWCDPCVASLPLYQKLHEAYKHRGFQVLAITVDEQAEAARSFVKKAGLTMPIGWDPKGKWPEGLGVSVMPTAFLVDPKGFVFHVQPGFHMGEMAALEMKIRAALDLKDGKVPAAPPAK